MTNKKFALGLWAMGLLLHTINGYSTPAVNAAATLHQYQLTTSTLLSLGDDTYVTQRARMLLDYRAQDTDSTQPLGDSATFLITPQMLQYKGHILNISSLDNAPASTELAKMLRAGFKVSFVQGKTGALIAQDETRWQQYAQARSPRQKALLNQALAPFKQAPMLPVNLKPEVGYSVVWPSEATQAIVQQRWTVTHVTEETLQVTMQSQPFPVQDSGKLQLTTYGQFEVDRQSGWLNAMVLIEQKTQGEKTQTQRWVMAPITTQYVSDMLWFDEPLDPIGPDEDPFFPITPLSLKHQSIDADFSVPMLAADQGVIIPDDNGFSLRYIHGLSQRFYAAQVSYNKVQLRDKHHQAIPLTLWQHSYYDASNLDGAIESQLNIIPLIWDDNRAALQALDTISADITLTPSTSETVTLSWSQLLAAPYHSGDASMRLTRLKTGAEHYRLEIYNSAQHTLDVDLAQFSGDMAVIPPRYTTPTWLSLTEQELLGALFPKQDSAQAPDHVFELRLHHTPSDITLLQARLRPDLARHKTVTFVDKNRYQADVRNPPLAVNQLDYDANETDKFISDNTPLALQAEAAPYALAPVSNNGHDLLINMPGALATACQPTITQGFDEGDNPVTWRLIQGINGDATYQLSTEDGLRRDFYDRNISGDIHCTGNIRWHKLPKGLTQTPWLVDVSTWLTASNMADEPSQQLMQYIKVWDENLRPLSLRLPHNSEQLTIKQVLVDGHLLSVNGAATHVRYLTITGEPTRFPYQFRFKPLP